MANGGDLVKMTGGGQYPDGMFWVLKAGATLRYAHYAHGVAAAHSAVIEAVEVPGGYALVVADPDDSPTLNSDVTYTYRGDAVLGGYAQLAQDGGAALPTETADGGSPWGEPALWNLIGPFPQDMRCSFQVHTPDVAYAFNYARSLLDDDHWLVVWTQPVSPYPAVAAESKMAAPSSVEPEPSTSEPSSPSIIEVEPRVRRLRTIFE